MSNLLMLLDVFGPLIILIPLGGSILAFLLNKKASKNLSFIFSVIQVFLTLFILYIYVFNKEILLLVDNVLDVSSNLYKVHNFSLKVNYADIFSCFGFTFKWDGFSFIFILLTNLLVPFIILSSFKDNRDSSFYGLILFMQFALIGVFTSNDTLTFYIFWELALIPIWFICGLYGTGENKYKVNVKFFVYTFVGSLFMLLAIMYLYTQTGTFSNFSKIHLSENQQIFIFWAFFIAFAVKLPIFPFHTWQADTYKMAPTQGSMLLSGIMLKMAIFGMIKYMLPITFDAFIGTSGIIALILCIISVIYGALVAMVEKDIKKIIAFSSMSHVGLIVAGIFAAILFSVNGSLNILGLKGAIFQVLAHGVNVVGMFYVADILYKKFETTDITQMGGYALKAPIFSVLFMIILLGTVGLPLTDGFIGEFILLKSIFNLNIIASILAGLTIILGAVYMTRLYAESMFGPEHILIKDKRDINSLDIFILGGLCLFVILLGIYPMPIIKLSESSINNILNIGVFH